MSDDEPTQADLARRERQRRLNKLTKVVEVCVCLWPLEVRRNGDGHAADCPAHRPLTRGRRV